MNLKGFFEDGKVYKLRTHDGFFYILTEVTEQDDVSVKFKDKFGGNIYLQYDEIQSAKEYRI